MNIDNPSYDNIKVTLWTEQNKKGEKQRSQYINTFMH